MKRLKIVLFSLLCLLMMACSNEYARREYDSNDKISQMENHYSKEFSVFKSVDGGYSLTVAKFDGRETLWTKNLEEDRNIEIDFSFSIAKGRAKIVCVDGEGNVVTVIECTPETSTDGFVTQTIALKSGENRLRIVGYDCEDVDLKMLFEEPQ